MEASSSRQEELSMEEQNYFPGKRGMTDKLGVEEMLRSFHFFSIADSYLFPLSFTGFRSPQFIRRNPVIICCAILGIGLVCCIALLTRSLRNDSAMFEDNSRRNTQWSQMFSLMSKEVFGINTNIMLLQEESKKSAVAVLESRNSVPSVLEELAELKNKTGRIAQDVAQVMGELYNITAAVMGNQNSVPSVLEELVELERENGRIAKDVAQGIAELKAEGKLTPSVLDEVTELKRLTGRMAKDVIQLLEEYRSFTEELCTGCPENWVLFKKHCYFFSTSKGPWLAAKQSCVKEGAHLVVINIQAEQSFLVKLAGQQVFWIGLSDTVKEGEWRWVDGTPLSISFWGPGEPNNALQGEDCATLLFNGKWNDAACHGNEYWICEQKC
ncbi:low affinity immunoglobulin epsilon Fc receptor-like [Podarcis raffonei]|uniref:low affinity immunoglobulin epsilon Fc receptor-like n=1 Tax=Podarcis raffonei TaxID=65483 RepID=UPI00232998A6|nr:low affinity immunoglobulin epsilon Fc receptor-like [Podarcis raffonei]